MASSAALSRIVSGAGLSTTRVNFFTARDSEETLGSEGLTRSRRSISRADSRDKDQDSELGIYVADEDDESRYEGKSNDHYDDGRDAFGARRDAKSDLDYDAKGD